MNKCKYCGYEHGMIGDVVCPVVQATDLLFQRKEKFVYPSWFPHCPIEICRLNLSTEEKEEVIKAKARFIDFGNLLDEIRPGRWKPKAQSGSSRDTFCP